MPCYIHIVLYIMYITMVIYNHLAWAGCVAYPWKEAMLRPEIRDGHESG